MPELQWTRTRPCATRALSMKSTMRCNDARKFPPSSFLSVQEMWQYSKSSSKKFSVSTAMFRTCVMRLLRKAMRSEAIAASTDEDQSIEPRTSQLFGVRRRRRSSAIERRVRPVRKHSSVEKTGHYGRDAWPPLPTAVPEEAPRRTTMTTPRSGRRPAWRWTWCSARASSARCIGCST